MVALGFFGVVIGGCGSSPDSDGWETKAIRANGTVAGCPRCSVLIGTAKDLAGAVRIRMVDTFCEKAECRIVAIDKEGKMRIGESTARIFYGGNCRSTLTVFSDIELADVGEFRFQVRPCQKDTARAAEESKPTVIAVQKRHLLNAAGEGDIFQSNYFN